MSRARGRKKDAGHVTVPRVKRLRQLMEKKRLDGLLITCMENVRYLSGFTGSAASVLMTPDRAYLFTDGRYITQARAEANGYRVKGYKDPLKELAEFVNEGSIVRLGVESEYLTSASFTKLKSFLRASKLKATSGLVEELRMVKDEDELRALQGAAGIVEEALSEVMRSIKPGMTEWDMAVELEHRFKLLGSEKNSFDFIVASGGRGALPHGIASNKKIRKGELVTIDCGTRWRGYYSDCTRTCMIGKPTRRQREIYQIVLDAQQKAIDAIRPNIKTGEVDAVARGHISAKGYGKNFSHSLGHGVGLAVHEEPRLSEGSTKALEAGMVVTVEPGIYIPDWGGVRIEDMVLVTDDGAEVLTKGVTKDFLIV